MKLTNNEFHQVRQDRGPKVAGISHVLSLVPGDSQMDPGIC